MIRKSLQVAKDRGRAYPRFVVAEKCLLGIRVSRIRGGAGERWDSVCFMRGSDEEAIAELGRSLHAGFGGLVVAQGRPPAAGVLGDGGVGASETEKVAGPRDSEAAFFLRSGRRICISPIIRRTERSGLCCTGGFWADERRSNRMESLRRS